jgi:hypothetical protein
MSLRGDVRKLREALPPPEAPVEREAVRLLALYTELLAPVKDRGFTHPELEEAARLLRHYLDFGKLLTGCETCAKCEMDRWSRCYWKRPEPGRPAEKRDLAEAIVDFLDDPDVAYHWRFAVEMDHRDHGLSLPEPFTPAGNTPPSSAGWVKVDAGEGRFVWAYDESRVRPGNRPPRSGGPRYPGPDEGAGDPERGRR